ncbi:hypothetical protein, partial [Dinghuibacter silviterrae]
MLRHLPLCFLLVLTTTVRAQSGSGGVLAKAVLDGSLHQISADSSRTVEDSAFFNPSYLGLIDTSYLVQNLVTLKINEGSNVFLRDSFTVTVQLRIGYTTGAGDTAGVLQAFTIHYDSAHAYAARSSFAFKGAHKVTITVLAVTSSVSSWDPTTALLMENQLTAQPDFQFSCSNTVTTLTVNTSLPDSADELPVSWTSVLGASQYDLEWTYVDSSALANNKYGSDTSKQFADNVFQNNATRVTTTGTTYNIPLIYDNTGTLFIRVRPVQLQGPTRVYDAEWSSDAAPSTGLGQYSFRGHQRSMNWQSNISFAEEGKRKVVVQYYDGSLRSRQTVTKDNTTDTTIVAETFYDYQGRPAIQVMPTPTLSSIIKYNSNFNVGINGAEYSQTNYDTLVDPTTYCSAHADPMGTSSGASQYYSPNNPKKTEGMNQFIPDAQNYPFTQTEYTADNTGRINRQGGVGPEYQLGTGHETKYYYGTPDQRELDALFGTEVGDHTHYFKNMVRDANGQYSISYVDMHGRTIATALAGNAPAGMAALPSNTGGQTVIENLLDSNNVYLQDLAMTSQKSLLVPMAGTFQFSYGLNPTSLSEAACNGQPICYTCLYDLNITITDNCNNQLLGGAPFDTVIHNYQFGSITPSCNTPSPIAVSFSKYLPEGSYVITKTLTVNRDAYNYYRDSVYLPNNTCVSLAQFIDSQRAIIAYNNTQCTPTCAACTDSIGTWQQFWSSYMAASGLPSSDTAAYRTDAQNAYNNALAACAALCNNSQSDANDIETAMLQDMTPPYGQYADTSSDPKDVHNFLKDKYNVFFTVPTDLAFISGYKQDTLQYFDENGLPDSVFDPVSGMNVRPQALSLSAFVANFKPTWALTLLKFHPEYCKLLALQAQAPSGLWDRQMEAVDDFATANADGYLNPTGQTTGSFAHFSSNSSFTDPASQETGSLSSIRNSIEQKMSTYQNGANGIPNLSIWSLACIAAKCGPTDQGCIDTYANVANDFNTANMCEGDLDMAWRYYREMYLQAKQDIINTTIIAKVGNCSGYNTPANGTGTPNSETLFNNGHQPEFTDKKLSSNQGPIAQSSLKVYNQVGNNNTAAANLKAAVQDSINAYNAQIANQYATVWATQLSPCNYDAVSLNDTIIPRLTALCLMATDADHPYGASTLPPGETYTPQGTSYVFTSFQDIINAFNAAHGISTTPACNAELITSPAPYTAQTIYSAKPVYTRPSDCECGQINNLYAEYQSQGVDSSFSAFMLRTQSVTMSDADLNQLRSMCNYTTGTTCVNLPKPIYLPPSMQCGSGEVCAKCYEVGNLYNSFLSAYPGDTPRLIENVDTPQQQINTLFQNYMNNRLGFNKQAWEYLAFMDTCTNHGYLNYVPPTPAHTSGIHALTVSFPPLPISCDSLNKLLQLFNQRFPTNLGPQLTYNVQIPANPGYVYEHVYTPTGSTPDSIGDNFGFGTMAASTWQFNGQRYKYQTNIYFNWSLMPIGAQINYATFNLFAKDSALHYPNSHGAHYRLLSDSVYGVFEDITNFDGTTNAPILTNTDSVTIASIYTPNAYSVANPSDTDLYSDQDYVSIPLTSLAQDMYNNYNTSNDFGMLFYLNNDSSVFVNAQYGFWDSTATTPAGKLPYLSANITISRDQQFAIFVDSVLQLNNPSRTYSRILPTLTADGCLNTFWQLDVAASPTLCGKNIPIFPPMGVDSTNNCSDSAFFAVSKGTGLYNTYADSLTGDFEQRYLATCMNAYKYENFTVTYQKNEYHYTLYYYDQAGNLVKTVPPAGVHPDFDTTWADSVDVARAAGILKVPSNTLPTQYRYNSLNQVVSQISPDGGQSNFWYDRLGRLAVSQNARQAPNSQYSYTLYDTIGRIIEVGQLTNSTAITDVIGRTDATLQSWINGVASSKEQITQTGYDYAYSPIQPALSAQNLRNRVAYSAIFTSEADVNTFPPTHPAAFTFYSYDILGNVDTLLQQYPYGVMYDHSNSLKKIVYDYDLQSGKVDKVAFQHGYADAFYHVYQYDAENRLTNVSVSADSLNWDNDAYYSYYLHGPLARTVIGDQQVQGLNYAYTLQGWMKAVNPPIYNGTGYSLQQDGTSGSPVASNAYNLLLNYHNGDFSAISGATGADNGINATFGGDSSNLFNGNIASMGVNVGALGHPLLYNYQYDQLNRLLHMDAWNNTGSTWASSTKLPDFKERVAYDPNGNILQYLRNGNNTFAGQPIGMDSLNYSYTAGTNRLDHINDSVPSGNYTTDIDNQSSGNYSYDPIGELTSDAASGITSITWTVYGKINTITKSDGSSISFMYDASGNRISKAVTNGGGTTTTWYVRDAKGNVLNVYTYGNSLVNSGDLTLSERDLYGSNRLGIVRDSVDLQSSAVPSLVSLPLLGWGNGFNFTRGKKVFELFNHLGNVLATISDRRYGVSTDGSTVDHFAPVVL